MLRRSLLRRLNCKAERSRVFLSPFSIRNYNDANLTEPLWYSIASSTKPFSHRSWHTQNSESVSGLPIIDDTIYALSTAQGRAGIAVIRISGPSCLEVSVIQIIHIQYLIFGSRFTRHFAHQNHCQNQDMQQCGPYMTLGIPIMNR